MSKVLNVVRGCSKVIDAACEVGEKGYFNFADEHYMTRIDDLRKTMSDAVESFEKFESDMKGLAYTLNNPGEGGDAG